MLIRPWVLNGVFRREGLAGWETVTHATAVHMCTYTHLLFSNHSFKMHTPTHTYSRCRLSAAQYLGGYSGEEGALRDAFGYLQSLYPQRGKHQLLLGRTQDGGEKLGEGDWWCWGVGEEVAAQGWESKGRTCRNLSWSHTAAVYITPSVYATQWAKMNCNLGN